MTRARQAFKAFTVAFLLSNFLGFTFVARLFLRSRRARRRFSLLHAHRHSRIILRVMGVDLVVENPERLRENVMILSNHMSWLDGLLMSSLAPTCFVTSHEMRETPVLGLITELAGCLYVERRSKDNIHREIHEITEALRDGFHVTIFPEATSTDGSSVRPFKRPLLTAACDAGRDVLPMVIQYEEIDGSPVTSRNRDLLCWYGSMSFAPHYWAVMGCRKIRIRVKILPEISVNGNSTRDTIVETAEAAVRAHYRPIL
ncbi:MAG: 1-acyl-sn-glycerol-3-phosphate acyltransferase [Bdellovibrionales bacterium]|nr:1-acyl-sn-glycerol-3-phosphate acyltransferase [Bdellovibrionales bacterium]